MSKYIVDLLNEGNILAFEDDLSGGSIKKLLTLIESLNCWSPKPIMLICLL